MGLGGISLFLGKFLHLYTLLLLVLGFLLKLVLAELFKDILVVQEGVGELIHEDVLAQELFDALINNWDFENLVDIRSRMRISL